MSAEETLGDAPVTAAKPLVGVGGRRGASAIRGAR